MNKQKPTLGEVITARREELGLTMRALARAINTNHATISKIESNPNIVAEPNTLKGIARELRLDYNYLLSLNKTIEDNKEIRIIARASKSMSGPEREKMMDLLRKEFANAFDGADSEEFIGYEESNDF
jgi:transcriptional regulator with XRE-family HTH domain